MNECQCLDFPCSWTYYRAHCIEQHLFDPGDDRPDRLIEPDRQVSPPRLGPDNNRQDIDQLKGNLVSLRDILKQHVTEAKSKKKIVKVWD